MEQTVTSSIISDVIDLVKSLSNSLANSLKSLADMGIQYEDAHKDKEGNPVFTVTVFTGEGDKKNKHQFKCKVLPSDKKGYKELHFKSPSGQVIKKQVKDDKTAYDKAFQEVAKTWFDVDSIEDAVDQSGRSMYSSKQLSVQLRKVQGETEDCIELIAVNCSYDPAEALSTLNTVLDDPSFVQSLTEDPMCFSICDNENDIDVCLMDGDIDAEYDCNLTCILEKAVKLRQDLEYFSWTVSGKDIEFVRSFCEQHRYSIMYQIDTLVSILQSLQVRVPHPSQLSCESNADMMVILSDSRTIFARIREDIVSLLSSVELYWCNMENYVQMSFAEISKYWHTVLNTIDRYLA